MARPSKGTLIKCDLGHKGSYQKFAFLGSLADGKPLTCKECKGNLSYVVHHYYPQHNREELYYLDSAIRLIGETNYYPFLLKLRNKKLMK